MEENLMFIMKILIIIVVLLNSIIMRLRTGNNSTIIIGVFVSIVIAKPMEFYNILATISESIISNFWNILWTILGTIAFILVLNLFKRKNKCK